MGLIGNSIMRGPVREGRGSVDFTWSDLAIDGGVNIGTEGGVCYDNDLVLAGGIMVGRTADPAAGNIEFTGALRSYKNSTSYTGYIYVPLSSPLTSTSWDTDGYSTTAKTLIDLSAMFGAPAGIKAVAMRVEVYDATAGDYWITLSPNNTAYSGPALGVMGLTANAHARGMLILNCDANGDIYYQIAASGSLSLHVSLQIHGYWI